MRHASFCPPLVLFIIPDNFYSTSVNILFCQFMSPYGESLIMSPQVDKLVDWPWNQIKDIIQWFENRFWILQCSILVSSWTMKRVELRLPARSQTSTAVSRSTRWRRRTTGSGSKSSSPSSPPFSWSKGQKGGEVNIFRQSTLLLFPQEPFIKSCPTSENF